MRKIKFRVWDGVNMHYLDDNSKIVLEFNKISGWNLRRNKIGINEKYISGESSENTVFKMMQYTGLKDKNGTEIYEGDKIVFVWFSYGEHELEEHIEGVIEFLNGSFMFCCNHGNYPFSELNFDSESDIEIIGNIHENKYLI